MKKKNKPLYLIITLLIAIAGVMGMSLLSELMIENSIKDIKMAHKNNYKEELNRVLKKKSENRLKIVNITYEEYNNRVANKETFVIYVGRSTCDDCEMFESILSNVKKQGVIYKLDTQEYKDAIDQKKENAKEEYEYFKKQVGYEWIPYVYIVYEGEKIEEFDFDFPEKISKLTTEEKKEFQNNVKINFEQWLNTYQYYLNDTDTQSQEACGIDERCE